MKYLITTDTHLGRKNGNQFEISNTSKFFDWLTDVASERNIENLIHLGDWYDNRRSIPVPVLNKSVEIIDEISQYFSNIYILAGNHDLYYKDAVLPSSLEIFHYIHTPENTHINVVYYPIVVDNILLIPWLINEENYNDIVSNNYNAKYAMGHLAINNIIMNRAEVRSKNEILNLSDFEKYDVVMSGHYHQYGEYQNVVYIGAPYHMDFNDSGKRGVYIFDSEDGSTEFIEYNGSPKYIVVDAENYNKDTIEGNNIKLEFYNNIGLNKINEIIEDVNCLGPNSISVSYKFTTTFTNNIESDTMIEYKPNKELLVEYLKESELPSNLSIKVFENIISSMENQ
ncbi:MAG: metallophosphoesterase [archaeon]